MDDRGFKNHIEEGNVIRFRHKNGRTFFCEQYNPKDREYTISEKLLKALSGKTIEQQMEYYYVTESARLYRTAYGEISNEDFRKYAVGLCDYEGVKKLLIKDGILIGARIAGQWGEDCLLPESRVCTYYASDNEGSGTKEREDYAYLIFRDSAASQRTYENSELE